jgi:hypothetical protein
MNKVRTLFSGLLLLAMTFTGAEPSSAQHKLNLPPELNERSSPADILSWLDKTSLSRARVAFSFSNTSNSEDSNRGPYGDATRSAKMVFSDGFRLLRLEGCHLTLRNEVLTALYFSSKDHTSDFAVLFEKQNGNSPLPRAARLVMSLERLNATKGGPPRRYTAPRDQAEPLGKWRTRFSYGGFFARSPISMSIYDPERGMKEIFTAGSVTMIFDDQETSKRFDAAFRRAIKLCHGK